MFKNSENVPQHTQRLILKQIPANVLMQTINLLGLPLAELETAIKNEVEENPFLEMEEGSNYFQPIQDLGEVEESLEKEDIGEVTDTYEISKIVEEEYRRKKFFLGNIQEFESRIYKEEGLKEHLLFQARLDIDDERLLTLASYIISELDEDGYLRGDIGRFKEIEDYKFTEEEIESVIKRIQKYDPIGCASRSIEECLIVQLETVYPDIREVRILRRIIEEDLEKLAKRDYNYISKKYGIERSEVDKFLDILRTLDPRPGRNFSGNFSFVLPEAVVRVNEDGKLEVEFNDSFIPKLKIKYVDVLKVKDLSEEMKEKLNKAKMITTVVEYRKELLRRIIEKIVEVQKDFLLGKENYLKPLTIKDLAEELGVSISTVSRAIKDKYILTPKGMFLLKHLLTRSAFSLSEDKVSVDKIKEMIKDIIRNEKDPLSDQSIARILLNKGIKISRRTVAKYREEMGIPPAFQRKKDKQK